MSVQKGFRNKARLVVQLSLQRLLMPLMARRYAFIFPQAIRVFSPWFEPAFRRDVFAAASGLTLLTEDRCYLLDRLVRQACLLDGDLAECGVYRGGSALLIARAMKARGWSPAKLYLFDTFAGMPDTHGLDAAVHGAGDFDDTSIDAVAALLAPYRFVRLLPGLIPASFRGLEAKRFAFVHIDVDLHASTMDCLAFFYPRLVPGGLMLFDDYGIRIYEHAEKRAVDEFFADKPEQPISLTNGQTIVIKGPAGVEAPASSVGRAVDALVPA